MNDQLVWNTQALVTAYIYLPRSIYPWHHLLNTTATVSTPIKQDAGLLRAHWALVLSPATLERPLLPVPAPPAALRNCFLSNVQTPQASTLQTDETQTPDFDGQYEELEKPE